MNKPILASMLSCSGTALTDEEKYLYAKYNPLGVSLFARNISNKERLKKLIDEIKNSINRDDVLIAVDEEGGRVSRLNPLRDSFYASPELLGLADVKYTKMHAELIATELKEVGINVNYSPTIDKKISSKSKVLEGRCFSSKEDEIVQHATMMADTYIDMGVCPCIKHIPGHLNVDKDPHLDVIEVNFSYDEIIEKTKYLQNFSKYPFVMTAHIKLNSIDEQNPVSTSKKVIFELIRKEYGFDGLIISDAIDMHSLSGTIKDRFIACFDAGVDVTCYCSGKYNEMLEICSENRLMTEKSLIRFANIKKIINNKPKQIDVEATKFLYREKFGNCLDEKYSYDATEVLHHMQKKGVI